MNRPIQSLRSEFSHRTRAYNLARLRAELFDILVIGGGITGAGIAREAALRGYKVALVEKEDFASGASSQSSKLIHGGVRYLEQFHLALVYEASQERRRLLLNAQPHVWPLPFLYPIYENNRYGPFLINLGLWLYDALALFRNIENHRMLTTAQIARQLPYLDVSRIVGGAHYYDAQMDDSRLCLETIRSAHRYGAVIANHARVVDLLHDSEGHVQGVFVRDQLDQDTLEINARVVVNATGPWTDQVLALDSPANPARLRPTKGIHLLVARSKLPVPEGVAFTERSGGRLMFLLPQGRFTLIGTTDTPYEGSPDQVHADQADVDYVLAAIASEFPGSPLTRADIVSTFAGLRPLVARGKSDSPGAISREHEIWITSSGLVSIAGGKYTTYRAMAEQLVSFVQPILRNQFGVPPARPSRSARLPLLDPDSSADRARIQNAANEQPRSRYWKGIREAWTGQGASAAHAEIWRDLPRETRDHLARAYGARHVRVLDYVAQDAQLRAPIVDGYPYIWAEVPHAVEQEMALTVSDVMSRRLHLFHQVPDGAVVAAQEIARYMARFLDWLDTDIERQIQAYAEQVGKNRQALKG